MPYRVHFATEAARWFVDEPNAWPPWREATVVLKGSDISNRAWLIISVRSKMHVLAPISAGTTVIENTTESSYKLQLDDRIVCVRFANEVVGTNFYRQLSHFIQHGPVVNEQEKDALNAEAAEISRSGSWIVL